MGKVWVIMFLVELYIVDNLVFCILQTGVGFLENYGWFIVFGVIILIFLWSKLKPYWRDLQRRWEQQRDIANFGELSDKSGQTCILLYKKMAIVSDFHHIVRQGYLFNTV